MVLTQKDSDTKWFWHKTILTKKNFAETEWFWHNDVSPFELWHFWIMALLYSDTFPLLHSNSRHIHVLTLNFLIMHYNSDTFPLLTLFPVFHILTVTLFPHLTLKLYNYDSPILILFHSDTFVFWHFPTNPFPHLHFPTVTVFYYDTFTLWHFLTLTLSYYANFPLLTLSLSHSDTLSLWYFPFLTRTPSYSEAFEFRHF